MSSERQSSTATTGSTATQRSCGTVTTVRAFSEYGVNFREVSSLTYFLVYNEMIHIGYKVLSTIPETEHDTITIQQQAEAGVEHQQVRVRGEDVA